MTIFDRIGKAWVNALAALPLAALLVTNYLMGVDLKTLGITPERAALWALLIHGANIVLHLMVDPPVGKAN